MPRRAAAKTTVKASKATKKGRGKALSTDEVELSKEQENGVTENVDASGEGSQEEVDENIVTRIQVEVNGKDEPIKRKADENEEDATEEPPVSPVKRSKRVVKKTVEKEEDSMSEIEESEEKTPPPKGKRGRQPKVAPKSEENGTKAVKPKKGQTTKRAFDKTEGDTAESDINEKEEIDDEIHETKPKRGRPAKKGAKSSEQQNGVKDETQAKRGRGKANKQAAKKGNKVEENDVPEQNGQTDEKVEEVNKKPRGRGKKAETVEEPQSKPKPRRGRQAKADLENEKSADNEAEIAEEPKAKPRGRRGRPKQTEEHEENGDHESEMVEEVKAKPKGRRGRPKAPEVAEEPEEIDEPESEMVEEEEAKLKPKGKRGRPKAREASEEPEDDNQEAEVAEEEVKAKPKGKRGRPKAREPEEHDEHESEIVEDEVKPAEKEKEEAETVVADPQNDKSDDQDEKQEDLKKAGKGEKRGRKTKKEESDQNGTDKPKVQRKRAPKLLSDDVEYTRKTEYDITKYLTEETWKEALDSEMKRNYFLSLQDQLGEIKDSNFFPPEELVFNAFNLTPLNKIKLVILGQDPYHDDGQAHGLAFSVPEGIDVPKSLKNIYKELSSDIDGFEAPNSGCLTKWAEQGIFLLNTALTVLPHEANSHAHIGWQSFTEFVIKLISDKCSNVVFVLWGKQAHLKGEQIDEEKHLVLKGAHPSPLSYTKFTGCKHFSKANEYLKANDKEPIDWKL